MSQASSYVVARAAIALAIVVSAVAAFVALDPEDAGEVVGSPRVVDPRAPEVLPEVVSESVAQTRSAQRAERPAHSDDVGAPARGGARPLVKERDFRTAFRERQRAEPGWLEREAAELLGPERSGAEQVALLRALEDCGSAELVAWLEHAVRRCPDVASAQGVSTPTFALARLRSSAATEVEARRALVRLAFESPALSRALRTSAATAVAALSTTEELLTLERNLRAQREPELLESVIAALGARSSEDSVAALLSRNAWSPPVPREPAAETVIE